MPNDNRIIVDVRDHVAYLTINRPEARNALTKAMYSDIREACEAANSDPAIHALVLRGCHGAFAVGGDLKEMLAMLESGDPTSIMSYDDVLPFEAVRSMRKPTIASIDGLCLGGGLTLALMCDMAFASDRSRFAIPEAKVGIVDGHMPRLLRDTIAPARLRYWMYTGAMFPAGEAYEAGLLTKVVPVDALEGAVEQCLLELKASSPEAILTCKRILNETRELSPMTDAYLSMLRPGVLKRLQQFRAK